MRVTVLGGYAGVTSTGAGCSGYLIRDGSTAIVADLGPGTLGELRRHVALDEIDGIVVSHGHLDHILDLAALHLLLLYGPTRGKRRLRLFLPPDPTGQLDRWRTAIAAATDGSLLDETFDVAEYDPSQALTIGPVEVRFAPTVHPLQAYAMRFTGDRHAIGFTADTGPAADLNGLFAGVDVLISEATLAEVTAADGPGEARGHLTATEAGLLATRASARTLVLSHRWEEHDAASQRSEAALDFPGRILMSAPGLTVDASHAD